MAEETKTATERTKTEETVATDAVTATPTTTDKYQPFTAEFDDFDGNERKETLRLSKPGRKELTLMARTSKEKQFDVLCKVMLGLVHPEDKEKLNKLIADEPVLAMSFAGALMKACGSDGVSRGN